jgi:GLPGLI family protein
MATNFKFSFIHKLRIASLLIFFFCFSACKNLTTKKINKGTIEYEITYPNPSEVIMSIDLMPKAGSFRFIENKASIGFEAAMGVHKTIILTDYEKKTIVQTLDYFGKKYKVDLNKTEIDSLNKVAPELKIEHTKEVKKIAGYDCYKVKCSTKDANGALINYDVYYTKAITAPHVNWFGIYKGIDGMLMEYIVERYGITMKWTAKSVSPDGAEDAAFELEGEYKEIPAAEMDSYYKMY